MIGSYPGKQVQRYWKCVLTKPHRIVEKYVDKLREEHWGCTEKKTLLFGRKNYLLVVMKCHKIHITRYTSGDTFS